jgi:hypothetical protein
LYFRTFAPWGIKGGAKKYQFLKIFFVRKLMEKSSYQNFNFRIPGVEVMMPLRQNQKPTFFHIDDGKLNLMEAGTCSPKYYKFYDPLGIMGLGMKMEPVWSLLNVSTIHSNSPAWRSG